VCLLPYMSVKGPVPTATYLKNGIAPQHLQVRGP
jgi:hypothetical protein